MQYTERDARFNTEAACVPRATVQSEVSQVMNNKDKGNLNSELNNKREGKLISNSDEQISGDCEVEMANISEV